MKKRVVTIIKKFIFIVVVFICFCVVFSLPTMILEYSARPKNQKADDEISQAVYEAMDGREIYYWGSEVSQKGNITVYTYLVTADKTILPELVEVVNEAMSKNEKNDRVRIVIRKEIYSGAYWSLMAFSNYHEKDGGFEDYDKIRVLELWGSDVGAFVYYNEPAIYEGFQGITYLKIRDYMAEITTKEDVDWYEYFPDLETLEVVPVEN